jgi:SAM-dependent methyltransferase
MENVVANFNWLSEIYSKYRPSYPEDCINYISKKWEKEIHSVGDIGAWTWKLTKLFIEKWYEVYAIDPNEGMLNQACKYIWDNELFHPILASAESTTLGDNSLDLIVVGQAFHWFNHKLFKKECKRILKNNIVAILYNNWDKNSEIIQKIDQLSKKYCPMYKGSSWWLANHEDIFKEFFYSYEKISFNNDYHLTLDDFLWLNFSASYAPKKWSWNYEIYLKELKNLFNEFSDWNILIMPNNTILRIGNL